jgi:chemotaxis family two-component system sensor kinase Cph1
MGFSYAYSLKNNKVTLTNCDREPVHIPGCIQPFGCLLALNPQNLTVIQVSDNAQEWLNKAPGDVVGQPLMALVGEENAMLLRTALEEGSIETNPRYLFSFTPQDKKLDALLHLHNGVLIMECEDADIPMSISREQAYSDANRIIARLQKSPGLREFCRTLSTEIRKLTGLDRVMIYRFMEDLSGEVYAEAKREDLHPYLGLHYPSEDIPQPARDIFRKIWVRPLPSVSYIQSEIIPLVNPITQKPLDLTYSFLRGASVMYTDYLKNMGVEMAFTLSIVVEGKLWGLVACHHYSPKIIPWPLRAVCELLAQTASLQLSAIEQNEFAGYRARLEESAQGLMEQMLAEGRELPELINLGLSGFMEADGVALLQNGKWHTQGAVPNQGMLQAIAEWVKQSFSTAPLGTEILHTHALSERLPAASICKDTASGLLAVPISRSNDRLILWFRGEVVQTVNWAGDPYSKKVVDSPGGERLMPRSSFALWQEKLRGHSLPWKALEVEAARRLRLAIMEVVVATSENVSRLNRELAASNEELDAFAYVTSHDLREPLRGIYHYAHYLKEDATQRQDEESEKRSESLLRLTKRMDSLIESLLHFSRLGRGSFIPEPVDMRELVEESIDILRASRAELKPEIRMMNSLPPAEGNPQRLRELWLSIIGNTLKYNKETPVIDIGFDMAKNAYFVSDNGIGIAPENRSAIFSIFNRLHAKDQFGGGSGVGLAIVKKNVEQHNGRIWVETPQSGIGTVFYFTLNSENSHA